MRWTVTRMHRHASIAALVLILAASAAHADAIQPSYTVTDLGNQNSVAYPSTGANGTVTAADGHTTYAFPQTVTGTPLSSPYPAGFPVPEAAPTMYGGTFPNSSSAIDATVYPGGLAVAIDDVIQNNGDESQTYVPYLVQRNADGSWGAPVVLGSGYEHTGPSIPGDGSPGVQTWVDKSGNILLGVLSQENPYQSTYSLYNPSTQSFTNISSLPALVNNGYSDLHVIAMADNGTIFGWALHQTASGGADVDLLLTPPGVSSAPIAMNAPEPGSLAVMALAMAALAARRVRRRI